MRAHAEIIFINEAFYRAFHDRDFAAMDALWARAEPVTCIHPGWPALTGRQAVLESWRRILEGEAPRIVVRAPEAFVIGDVGYVLCYETIGADALIATNIFRCEDGAWRLIHHQAGPAPRLPPLEDAEPTRMN